MSLITSMIIFGGAFLIACFGLAGLRVIQQYERGIKFTMGVYKGIMQPGLRYLVPIFQSMERVDIRQATINLDPQEVMTKDQVNLRIDGVVFYHITKPEEVILHVQNLRTQIADKATSELKEVVGKMIMSDALQKRDQIAADLKKQLDEAIDDTKIKEQKDRKSWGIEIKSIQINNVELPPTLVRAMAKEAEAEREKKAIIIRASGEEEAAQKYSEAADKYAKSPGAMKLRELKTWEEIGKEQNSLMIVVPSDATANPLALAALGKDQLHSNKKIGGEDGKHNNRGRTEKQMG